MTCLTPTYLHMQWKKKSPGLFLNLHPWTMCTGGTQKQMGEPFQALGTNPFILNGRKTIINKNKLERRDSGELTCSVLFSYFTVADLPLLVRTKDRSNCVMMAQTAECCGKAKSHGTISHLYDQSFINVTALSNPLPLTTHLHISQQPPLQRESAADWLSSSKPSVSANNPRESVQCTCLSRLPFQ